MDVNKNPAMTYFIRGGRLAILPSPLRGHADTRDAKTLLRF